jgi:hypothetical protein
VSVSYYCADHAARQNQLVGATSVVGGRSVCTEHTRSTSAPPVPLKAHVPDCAWCKRWTHRAYFVVDQLPLCIRHAADAMFPDDDMGAHDMAHAAYLQLGAAGVPDAY